VAEGRLSIVRPVRSSIAALNDKHVGEISMTGRTFLTAATLVSGSVLLAACSNWSYTPPMRGNFLTSNANHKTVDAGAPPAGGNFIQETAHDYAGLADYLAHHGQVYEDNYEATDYFSRKGIAAESGQLVPPEDNANWAIPLEQPYGFRTQMAHSRKRLVTDLDNGGRDRFPGLAARAQVAYDCWLERTEMNWQTEFDGQCHKDFITTLNALEQALNGKVVAAPGAHEYNVYFEFDRSNLTPEGRQVVDTVAQAVKGQANVHVHLLGKADLTGTDPYNMSLSHRRADAVRARLHAQGVDDKMVDEKWDGFRNPPVPTEKGIREPRNRVVEVNLQ
jgi:outer membrane protein OmpA-like peptidoglycan-associated protein